MLEDLKQSILNTDLFSIEEKNSLIANINSYSENDKKELLEIIIDYEDSLDSIRIRSKEDVERKLALLENSIDIESLTEEEKRALYHIKKRVEETYKLEK